MSDNRRWFLDINDWARHTSSLHGFFKAYASWLGIAVIAVLVLAGYVMARRSGSAERLGASLWSGLAAPVAWGLNQPIVSAWDAKRPWQVFPHALMLVSRSHDPSAPSDHSVAVAAAAVALIFVESRLLVLAIPAALLMGFSRIYVGAHFPEDVAAGLAVGTVVALLGWAVLRVPSTRLVIAMRRTPLRVFVPA